VFNVANDADVEITDFVGAVTARAAGDVTPLIGAGLQANFYQDPTREALDFDGVDDVVTVTAGAGSALTTFANQTTIEARVRIDALPSTGGVIATLVEQGGGTRVELLVSSTGALVFSMFQGSTVVRVVTAAGAIGVGTWTDIAAVMDRMTESLRIYVNGTQIAFDNVGLASLAGGTFDLTIGQRFNGAIGEVAIWSTARSATEVQADRGTIAPDTVGLVALYLFDELSGDKVFDATSNDLDGLLGGGIEAQKPARIQGELLAFPNFDTLAPTHSMIDGTVDQFSTASNFNGIAGLTDRFAARWTGTLFVPVERDIQFVMIADNAARVYVDGTLVLHESTPFVGGTVQGGPAIHLTAGVHDLRIEYFEDDGNAAMVLAWDVPGFYAVIPAENLLRVDQGATDPTFRGAEDLVITDDSGVRIVHGRARSEWTDLDIDTVPVVLAGAKSAVGLGDVNRDGREDFAVLTASELRVYSGGGLPGTSTVLATISTFPFGLTGASVEAAGDIDGDGAADILVTGTNGSALIFGGTSLTQTRTVPSIRRGVASRSAER